jgi:hypothetical protein
MGIYKGKFNIKGDGHFMNHFLYLPLVAMGLTIGCSGGADASKPASAVASNLNATAVASNTTQSITANSAVALNAETNIPPAGVVESAANKRKVTDVPGSARPVLRYEPAAEDSEIASAMNNSGQMYEVRVWKRDPQLVKVESVWLDPNSKALTILLRSGKVLNITTDKIVNLKQATAKQILDIAGVQSPAGTPAVRSKGDVKKAE